MRAQLKHLTTGVAIYGVGDVAVSVVSLLLIAVYIKGEYLTEADYGALALLVGLETFLKVIFRWGLDGAFMRYYHDRADGAPRRALASTIVWFMLAADVVLLALLLAASPAIAAWLSDTPDRFLLPLRLMLVNTFLLSFTFLPFHLMRLRNESVVYSAFAFARAVGTLLLRIVFVIGFGLDVTGLFLADLLVTIVLLPFLWPRCRTLVGASFSAAELRLTLRFGLPRLPHGVAAQTLDAGNKLLFSRYVTDAQLGVYQIGATLGQSVKFFLAAFETAWAPFYYDTSRRANAREVFGKVTTYVIAILALLVGLITVAARDAILVMATPDWLAGAPVMPLIALGLAFQGIYLLTSIGLNLTSRTEFYPVSTIAAAAVGLSSGAWLMPRYGAIGAAVAFLLSYVTQAAIAFAFSRRLYRIPYEAGRLSRIVAAAVLAIGAGLWLVPAIPPLAGVLLRSIVTTGTYVALLWVGGFLRPTERGFLRETVARLART
jgi:O-antigen/teichoic acid export membrane protein